MWYETLHDLFHIIIDELHNRELAMYGIIIKQ